MRELSKGEQKKTLMAMELMAPEANILMNEPLENLDSFTSKRVETFLKLVEVRNISEFRIEVKGNLPRNQGTNWKPINLNSSLKFQVTPSNDEI